MAQTSYFNGALLAARAGIDYPLPSWWEMTHPKQKDGRTTKEIVNDLIDKL